jgi:hypothetical protein
MRRLKRSFVFGLVMSPVLAFAQEDCKPLTDAKKLPALTNLLDSAALLANLTADPSGPNEVLVSVMTGSTPEAFVMDPVIATTATGTAVRDRVLSSRRAKRDSGVQGPHYTGSSVRLVRRAVAVVPSSWEGTTLTRVVPDRGSCWSEGEYTATTTSPGYYSSYQDRGQWRGAAGRPRRQHRLCRR